MNTLKILDWEKPKREVDFIGYNRDRTACFIRDEQGARRAINFWLPSLFKIHFRENPIPNSPPKRITRAALHVPACFASKAEMDVMRSPQLSDAAFFAAQFEPWKLITRHKCWLEQKHDKKLEKMLREEKQRLQRRYEARKEEVATWSKNRARPGRHCLENLKLKLANLPPEMAPAAARRLEACEKKFSAWLMKHEEPQRRDLEAEFTMPKFDEAGALVGVRVFDATLANVRQGRHGLREKLLHEEWAKHHGLNLDNIEDEAKAFRFWLGQRVQNVRLWTTDLRIGVKMTSGGLEFTPDQWEILEAAVNFQICFKDGTSCWLDGIEERPVADGQELDDFDRLEAAAEVAGDERMSLDEVCHALIVKRKGESKPMGTKGLEKLCAKASVPFKFPMRRSVVKKLEEHRKRQSRYRIERLRKHNQQTAT